MTQTTDHLNPDSLSAFIDGELSAAELRAMQQHISDCHLCALQIVSAMQIKTATARAGQRFAPPPEALARLTAQVQQRPLRNRPASCRYARLHGPRWLRALCLPCC